MNKRSKSENLLRLKRQIRQKQQQLTGIHLKIQKSQPILKTIYNKVKLKEAMIYQQLDRSKKKLKTTKQIVSEYAQLYREGLRIIEKNKFQDMYGRTTTSNYRQMFSKGRTQDDLKGKSMYEIYREKLGRVITSKLNPEFRQLPKKAKEIRTEIEDGIQEIKLIRKRSQNNLKSSRRKLPYNQNEQLPGATKRKDSGYDSDSYKEKFVEIQRKKLQSIV